MKHKTRLLHRMLAMSFQVEPRRSAVNLGLVVMLAGITAASAFAQRWLVDSAETGTLAGVLGAAALGALAYGLTATAFRVEGNLRGDISHHVAVRLSQETTATAASIPTMTHLEHPPYLDRIVMVRSGGYSIAGAAWAVLETLAQVVSLSLLVWLLATVHPVLAVTILFAAVPLYTADRGRRLVRDAADATSEAERVENELHGLCTEPDPAKEIRTSGAGRVVSDRADQIWGEALHIRLVAQLRSGGLQLAGWAAYIAAFVGSVAITAALVIDQRASLGDIVMVVFLAGQLRGQLGALVRGIVQIGEGGRAMSHMLWFEDYARRARSAAELPAPDRLREGIELNGVTFRYPGARHEALSRVDLRLPAGSTVAIVGINGAGKSTLVKLLTGMYEPHGGTITVDGTDLAEIDPERWRHRATGSFQDHMKFQLKAYETVGVGRLSAMGDRAEVQRAVDDADAQTVVGTLPDGLDSQLGRVFDGSDLSHGQWQRLALARGRMRTSPLLIILDEPTAALDPQAEHDIYERYAEQARATADSLGTITVMVSHRFSTVSMADLIVVLDQGRIIEQGTHAELLAADGPYAHQFRTQRRGYEP